jgi:hypothetical protein
MATPVNNNPSPTFGSAGSEESSNSMIFKVKRFAHDLTAAATPSNSPVTVPRRLQPSPTPPNSPTAITRTLNAAGITKPEAIKDQKHDK